MTPKQACIYAKKQGIRVTPTTVRSWLLRYEGLARKVGGRWLVDKEAFDEFLKGDCSEEEI